jgi:hypothetical protein
MRASHQHPAARCSSTADCEIRRSFGSANSGFDGCENKSKPGAAMYEMKFKLTVLASGYSKLFTTRDAAERFATLVLGLDGVCYKIEPIV